MPFLGKTPTKFLDANVNIDGGNIDGTTIGADSAAAGTFTNLTATGTLTLPDDGISGDDVNGGTISNFSSTGIDDNATSTAITIDSSQNVGIGTTSPSDKLELYSGSPAIRLNDTVGYHRLEGYAGDLYVTADQGNGAGAGNIIFRSNGTTERMRIDSSGNVGIGTTSPETLLMIEQAGTYTGVHNTAGLKIRNAAATTGVDNPYGAISLSKGTGSAGIAAIGDHATDADIVGLGFFVHGSATGTAAATRAMTIDSSGNVGIGTNSPAVKLHVAASGTPLIRIEDLDTARYSSIYTDNNGSLHFVSDGGSTTSSDVFTFNQGGSERMRIDTSGNVGIGVTSPTSKLHVRDVIRVSTSGTGDTATDGTVLSVGASGEAYLYNYESQPLIFATSASERMRIDSSGELMVNTTASSGTKLTVQGVSTSNIVTVLSGSTANSNVGMIVFRDGASDFCGQITTNGSTNTTAYNTSSDKRLKENIADADDAGSKIDAIKVRKFDWIKSGLHQDYGMVAQELVDVAPEAVTQGETEDDMWGVDYSKLVPMMIKEIQDLRARVAQLEGA